MVDVAGKRVVVMGLGRFGGGVGVTRWLCGQGASVCVTDLADETTLADSVGALDGCDVRLRLGGHDEADLDETDLVVVSPAVDKRRSSFFQTVVERRINWTTEINLFLERCPAKVVGVTGSFGKSTTAAMVAHVLTSGWRGGAVHLGGNIGRSLLGEVETMTGTDVVVLELSSFQLEDIVRIERRPDVGAILNVVPHHLERHGTFDAYRGCKLNMVTRDEPGMPVVLGSRDASLAEMVGALRCRVVDGAASSRVGALVVPGAHNWANAQVAAETCALCGVEDAIIARELATFPGLEHRLQFVAEVGGARYFNDSKATSLAATTAALAAFEERVVLLLGGRRGDEDVGAWVSTIPSSVRELIVFGDVRSDGSLFAAGDIPVHTVTSVTDAAREARALARPGDVVLFSPGFQSYDAYVNYESRGEDFIRVVRSFCR